MSWAIKHGLNVSDVLHDWQYRVAVRNDGRMPESVALALGFADVREEYAQRLLERERARR